MSWIVNTKKISDNISVAVIDIKSMDSDLTELIDKFIISICFGENSIGYDLNQIKNKLFNDLTKNGGITSDVKRGAIAEFFIHLYLNSNNFKQECFYLNLEEPKSIKKGFDGFYSFKDDEWIMESKSGLSTTKNICHVNKVKEAYADLKKKFSSDPNENDPWKNAYMHAGHQDLSTSESIKSKLRKCAQKFANAQPIDISEYKIIPASTIYVVNSNYSFPEINVLIDEIKSTVSYLTYKEILAICITQHSMDIFTEYLIEGKA